jgi:hypothetical protein
VPASAPLLGNGRALACRALRICDGVSVGSTDSISAAVPATIGDEKLVPSDALSPSL